MNIVKYNDYTETEIYNLINQVRKNDNEALKKLEFIFKNKLHIKNNSNYNNELTSFFHELLLKIPLDKTFQNHKLINYILSSFLKKKSKVFKAQANLPINSSPSNYLVINSTSNTSFDSIDDLMTLKSSFSRLSLDEKKLLSLYYKYGYTEEEIGKYFNGLTKAAISKRKKKILKKLQENF